MAVEITEDRLRFAVQKMADLTGEKNFVVIGRGTLAITAPAHLRGFAQTDDVDMWPQHDEKSALDRSIALFGEDSEFYRQHGFYIERVGSWTLLTHPAGWEERATKIIVGEDVDVLVLGLLDLGYNKLEAYREKDQDFLGEAFQQGLIDPEKLREFIEVYAPSKVARTMLLEKLAQVETKDSPGRESR